MNKNLLRSMILTVAMSAGLVGTAAADQIWNFSSLLGSSKHNTSLGATYTFTQGTNWMTATAVVPMWTQSTCDGQPCLYDKFVSGEPSESGLGLKPGNENEINFPDGIALQSGHSDPISGIEIGSLQTGESWALAGCSASFSGCTVLDTGVGGGTDGTMWINGLGSDMFGSYIVYVPCSTGSKCDGSKASGGNNILLLAATTVPEPGVLALFGAGLLGCAIFVGRRRRAAHRV